MTSMLPAPPEPASSSDSERKGYVNPAFESDGQLQNKRVSQGELDKVDPESGDGEFVERAQWGNSVEFLLSCISVSVGLGNIWRFPFVAYENGGGAFLIPYLIILVFIGRPLYFLETVLGQFSSSGSVKVWNVVPLARGIGYAQAIANWCVITYYVTLMAISFFYLFCSFQDPLPWTWCNPEWADNETCYGTSEDINLTVVNLTGKTSSSEQFFYNYVLNKQPNMDNGIGAPDWRLSLCLLLSWILIFAALAKGVASSGKVAYFTAIFPYIVLITLLIRGVTLPGAAEGILFFITPDFQKIGEAQVWYAAVTQCFFSLEVGFGPIITYSSYNNFRHKIYRDSTIVSFADCFTSILAGVTIFSILGNLAYETGQLDDIGNIVQNGGSGLAFVSYPEAISKFDDVPQLFSVLFFFMLITLAIGSAMGSVSSTVTILCDEMPKAKRWIVTALVCLASFLVGLTYVTPGGQYILDLIDYFGGSFVIYVVVIFETIFICWIYGLNRIANDIRFMLGFGVGIYWKLTWSIIVPIALMVIFVYSMITFETLYTDDKEPYPVGATVAGWIVAGIALIQIPIWAFVAVRNQNNPSWSQKFRDALRPSNEWGPANPKIKQEWIEYNKNKIPFSWIPKFFRRLFKLDPPQEQIVSINMTSKID